MKTRFCLVPILTLLVSVRLCAYIQYSTMLFCCGKLIYAFPEVDTKLVDLVYLCGLLAAVDHDKLRCQTVKRL